MTLSDSSALVSVGIPTYNRPDGLERALSQICNQTYKNIEIIVSDNCSDNLAVRLIIDEFMNKDPRIRYYRQPKNIGIFENFKFVYLKANGEYFMWAADDDEWETSFVEVCVENIGEAFGVMQSKFKTIYRKQNKEVNSEMQGLSLKKTSFENFIIFIHQTMPSLFYGLYRRDAINFVRNENAFEFFDIYFLSRVILTGGVNTFPINLYTQGIDDEEYLVKILNEKKKTKYLPLLKKTTKIIFSTKMSFAKKVVLMKCFFVKVLFMYLSLEKNNRIRKQFVLNFLKGFIFINNIICRISGAKNYSIRE